MTRHKFSKNYRRLSIVLILNLILSLIAPVFPARAEDPFPLPDRDGDGLSNVHGNHGWYIMGLAGLTEQTPMMQTLITTG